MSFVGEAVQELDFVFGNASTYVDAEGDAGEVCIFEFDSGALIAVVEEDVEACGGEGRRRFFLRLRVARARRC